jgi:protein SCO1/2
MPTKTRPKTGIGGVKKKVPGDWLELQDWRSVAIALIGTLVLTGVFGLMMHALEQSNRSSIFPQTDPLVIAPDYPRHLIDFSLVDQQGHHVTRRDLAGKIVVVNFLFTSCALVCPYVSAQMETIQKATAATRQVRLLSLALNPVDDNGTALSDYAARFHADPTQWSFLTGDQAAIHNLIATSFLPPDTTGVYSYMPGNFAHTQRIVLVDKSGHIVSYFDGLSENAADAALKQINKLLSDHD